MTEIGARSSNVWSREIEHTHREDILSEHSILQAVFCMYFRTLVIAILLLPETVVAQSADSPLAENSAVQTSEQLSGGEGKKLADLDIEQLAKTPVVVPSMDIPVTSVSKQESTVGRSPAAIFVITPVTYVPRGVYGTISWRY